MRFLCIRMINTEWVCRKNIEKRADVRPSMQLRLATWHGTLPVFALKDSCMLNLPANILHFLNEGTFR